MEEHPITQGFLRQNIRLVDENERLTRELAEERAEVKRLGNTKLGPDWREALPYETEIELAGEITRLQAKVERLRSNIERLETRSADLEDTIASLREKLSMLRDSLA